MHSISLRNPDIRRNIPERSGVYFFRDAQNTPVYIGKAINLRSRIWQHLTDTENPKEARIREAATKVQWYETNSELEALLFEANCVKKYQPKYNIDLKDGKSQAFIAITKEEYPRVRIMHESDLPQKAILYEFGPIASVRTARYLLAQLRHIVPFCMSTYKRPRPCFYSHLGQCQPCPGDIAQLREGVEKRRALLAYKKNIARLRGILSGNGNRILRQMQSEMKAMAKSQAYEKAAVMRDRIEQFTFLFQRPLIADERLEDPLFLASVRMKEQEAMESLLGVKEVHRIECFDISTFSAKQSVASCVVFINGVPDPSQYRRFRVRGKSDFDPEMMTEVIMRRLVHSEWPYPQLLVVDGGGPQLRAVVPQVLKKYPTAPLIIGIAKRPDRLINGITLEEYSLQDHEHALHLIQRLRDEAHRFAKKYHVSLRKKVLFTS